VNREPGSQSGGSAGPPEPPHVIALAADLMFTARIQGAARAVGAVVQVVGTAEALVARVQAAPPRRVLVDLDARRTDPVAAIAALKADPATRGVPVVAFVSHVRTEAIEAARAAGADQVLARSAFVKVLPDLLAGG
jgi:CheY-like chemotaxis protein